MATKVVLITGAAIRIGACIARTFHSKGFGRRHQLPQFAYRCTGPDR